MLKEKYKRLLVDERDDGHCYSEHLLDFYMEKKIVPNTSEITEQQIEEGKNVNVDSHKIINHIQNNLINIVDFLHSILIKIE